MKNGIDYAFIASPKVIRFKVGIEAADILATLIYKKGYWNDEEKLFEYKGDIGFYISNSDLEEETCYKSHTIKRGLAKLKNEGLIISKQRGLGQPNFYSLDESIIEQYIEDHLDEYENWRLGIRHKNKLATPINSKKELIQLSRKYSNNFQEGTQTTTTKNKITKNKINNTITNRINTDKKNLDLAKYSEKLGELIDNVREADENLKFEAIMEFYEFLCGLIPSFRGFIISKQDYELIEEVISCSSLKSFDITDKIISNAEAIINKRKKRRFGNLFVGLKEINLNFEIIYG